MRYFWVVSFCWQGVAQQKCSQVHFFFQHVLDKTEVVNSPKRRILFTFCWYLWWYLLLVVPAPFLPVPPLLLRQGRRHTDQTGDCLSWAGFRPDFLKFSAIRNILVWQWAFFLGCVRLHFLNILPVLWTFDQVVIICGDITHLEILKRKHVSSNSLFRGKDENGDPEEFDNNQSSMESLSWCCC